MEIAKRQNIHRRTKKKEKTNNGKLRTRQKKLVLMISQNEKKNLKARKMN